MGGNSLTLMIAVAGALICTGSLYYATQNSDVEIPQHVVASFTAFKSIHNKVYASETEHNFRLATFNAHYIAALEHNAKNLGSTYGVNKFSDLTKEEFKKQYLGYKPNANRAGRPTKNVVHKQLTHTNVDWRNTNLATPVKDQMQCGSCWAFSATEAIETGYAKQTGNTIKVLSPQQIVSCDNSDLGCNGGNTSPAYDYVQTAGGIQEESTYPYTSGYGDSGECQADSSQFVVSVTSQTTVSQDGEDEDAMVTQMAETPISVCVNAESWQTYTGGVVDITTCGTQLDHCVQAVGIQGDAWIVRNSWNTNWGEEGYIRVKIGENACGIAEDASVVEATDVSPY